MREDINKLEVHVQDGGQFNVAFDNGMVYAAQNNGNESANIQPKVKSRTQEYLDKWDENMFLNDFSEWDENPGVNIKLKDVYIEEHLPHFKWKRNNEISTDIKRLFSGYMDKSNQKKKQLLILGQPGIGKSTLITWLVANFVNRIADILIYRFSSDLRNIDWNNLNSRFKNSLLEKMNLSYNDLDGKILILDGFDEINIRNDRAEILNQLNTIFIQGSSLDNFFLIVTCRENYIHNLHRVKCDYIILQPWDEVQIKSFCDIYQEKVNSYISENTIVNILDNKEILGIPLILYMVLALNISIEKRGSIVDIYDKIFSLEDVGIYDRCIYGEPHRIGEIKEQIHKISKKIAIWIFENKSEEAYIPQEEYEKICNGIIKEQTQENEGIKQDVLIGNFFKLIKHCEGIGTEEIYFVHRTIYEYFVVESIYSSIKNAISRLTENSQEELAENIAIYLKQGQITQIIGEFLQYKVMQLYEKLAIEKKEIFYQWWEKSIEKMMLDGMFYYTKKSIKNFKNVIEKEVKCFINLLTIIRLLQDINKREYIMKDIDTKLLEIYIKYYSLYHKCTKESYIVDSVSSFNLSKMYLLGIDLARTDLAYVDLSGAYLLNANFVGTNLIGAELDTAILRGANLKKADLRTAKLREADLKEAKLREADLSEAKLRETDLRKADLREAKLEKADFKEAKINASIWQECDIQKALSQLKQANFVYIVKEKQYERKKIFRKDLFPDENSLLERIRQFKRE